MQPSLVHSQKETRTRTTSVSEQMDSEQSSDEEEPEPKQNAFQLMMMQPPSKKANVEEVDPIYIAVIYIRWLNGIDPSHPLFKCPYIGQAVRVGDTPEEVATKRWKAENLQAVREDKDIGLIHCLDMHGPAAFDNQIVESKRGPRSEVQEWANAREIELIAENGGRFRTPSVRCKQTLNLTSGGKGNVNFEAMDVFRTMKWVKFKTELEQYVECYETSLVPFSYVNPVSGYKLGNYVHGVRRQGTLWNGHPDEAARVAWLQALPRWAWKARETDEFKEAASKRSKEWRENATPEKLAEWSRKISDSLSTPAAKAAASTRAKAQVEREAAEGKVSLADRCKEWRDSATLEQIAEKKRKFLESKMTTDAARRVKVLEGLPEAERKKKENQYEYSDRRQAMKNGQANAMLQLPEYANQGFRWCYKNWTQAKKDGVVFSKDANGVWSARVREKGSGQAGSSTEHGAHV